MEDVHENKGLCLLRRSVQAVLSPGVLMKRLPDTSDQSDDGQGRALNSESEEEDKESEQEFRHDDGAAFP